MDRSADASKFTGQSLAWFKEGEEQAASELAEVAEQTARGRRRVLLALAVVALLALLGLAAMLIAPTWG